jgi:hypothetical protein
MTPRFGRVLAVTAAALTLAACTGDGDSLITQQVSTPSSGATHPTLFDRYVALGNSITAGFQGGGLVDSTQARAYPALLALRAGVPRLSRATSGYAGTFIVPFFRKPGCPVPMVAPLVNSTVTPNCTAAVADSVFYRADDPGNYAVPGAKIADLFRVTPAGATLNLQINGTNSQVHRMLLAHPTFVSAWIGNNDALGAALSGNLGPAAAGADSSLTRLSSFQASLNTLVDSIKAANPIGVMLVGVVNPSLAPLLQPGAYFYLARDPATGNFNGKPVNANCSPVTSLGTPNPLAANLVSFQIISSTLPEINCDPAAYPVGDPRRGVFLLDTQEQAIVTTRVNEYNAAIQAAATANNWVYQNPNAILAPFLAERTSGRAQRIRKCQDLATAATAAQFQAAILNTCPVTGPTAAPNFFGSLISFDGVHPSSQAHVILAGAFAAAINTRYGSTLSTATS